MYMISLNLLNVPLEVAFQFILIKEETEFQRGDMTCNSVSDEARTRRKAFLGMSSSLFLVHPLRELPTWN